MPKRLAETHPWIARYRAIILAIAGIGLVLYFAFGPAPSRSSTGHGVGAGSSVALAALIALVAYLAYSAADLVFTPRLSLRDRIVMLATIFAVTITCYAFAYFLVSRADVHAFSEPLSKIDAVYFSITAITTTGFGDISAKSQLARALVSTELLVGLLLLAVSLGGTVSYLVAHRRLADAPPCSGC